MTIRIELHPDEEQVLRERAQLSGRDVAEYIHLVLRQHIDGSKTFDQILTPVWEGFRDRGMTEDEAAEFLEEEYRAAKRERNLRS